MAIIFLGKSQRHVSVIMQNSFNLVYNVFVSKFPVSVMISTY